MVSQTLTTGDIICISSGVTVAAHRNEEKHHAAEGETACVAQVTCVALNNKKRMEKNDS